MQAAGMIAKELPAFRHFLVSSSKNAFQLKYVK